MDHRQGFLTGVLSRFVCNFFMGQGVWTPWEMAAWGLLGVLAGITFYKPELVGYFDDKKEIVRKQATTGLLVMAVPVVCMVVSGTCRIYCIFIYRKAKERRSLAGGCMLSVLWELLRRCFL